MKKGSPTENASNPVHSVLEMVDGLVFPNPGMSLKGEFAVGSADVPFSGRFHRLPVVVVVVNRHFHGPLPLWRMVHADLLICSTMVFLACCMRRGPDRRVPSRCVCARWRRF
jgi:hypothetical protein